MGFIFGLIVGAAVVGGGNGSLPMLGTIPFRCLAAFEVSEAEYRQCRTVSLRQELFHNSDCSYYASKDPTSYCSFDKAIAWEIAGLRELKRAMEAKKQ